MTQQPSRRPQLRCRPVPPNVVASVAAVPGGMPEAELLDRLDDALAALPSAERAAVMAALGYAEGVDDVAAELGLSPSETDVLVRSAVQLLRGALADALLDDGHPRGSVVLGRSAARRRRLE